MNYAEICIIKRDGKREDFSISKIKNAIGKAFHASGIDNEDKLIAEITMRVISNFVSPTISVEEIQDLVEKELMKVRPEVAKKYIIYREWRNTERDRKTQMRPQVGITFDLGAEELTVGRSPHCSIFLNDMTVSRMHATIEPEAGCYVIRDANSFNGVWVNNDSVDAPRKLCNGDVIQIGAFCLLYQEE